MSSDQELIIQFQQSINKEAVFTQLVQKHQQKVYYQIKRMVLNHADADDIAQLVWIKVWNKLLDLDEKLSLNYTELMKITC